ncbi:MAG: GNAT family N-acetyltransferase [Desulfobacteraceae bacterium]|nr:GNAT family N-acetyltransferase [Desulfobacteraceae bacterium]
MSTPRATTPDPGSPTIVINDASGWPKVPPGFSYPQHYGFALEIPSVGRVMVRPIRSQDAPLFNDLFNSLTPQSIYLRFFSILRELPPQMLQRLTQVDYDQEIVLVALQEASDQEIMLGDARIIQISDISAEFSVVVRDELHGKGIGACLLQHCLAIARQRGFKSICGFVLPENKQMLRLGKRLGFDIKHVDGGREFELTKRFNGA